MSQRRWKIPDLLTTVVENQKQFATTGTIGGVPYEYVYLPLTDHDQNRTLGILRVAMSTEEISKAQRGNIIYTIALAALVALLGIYASIRASQRIVHPMTAVMEGMKEAAYGRLRDAKQVKAYGELKELHEHYNLMIHNVRGLLETAAATAAEVASLTEQLHHGTQETAYAAEQITATIDNVASGSEQQNISLIAAQRDWHRRSARCAISKVERTNWHTSL